VRGTAAFPRASASGGRTQSLSTPRLLELLKSDVFAMHGYTELYLNGRWVKATPAFNQSTVRAVQCRWNSTESTTVFSTRSTAMASGRWSTGGSRAVSDVPEAFSSPTLKSAIRTFRRHAGAAGRHAERFESRLNRRMLPAFIH
jgi:transglutaminase-like putative cysteine protease